MIKEFDTVFDLSEHQRSDSVVKVFAVLEYLALQDGWVGPRALARDLGMSPATAHRYLATLNDIGYARHDSATGHYALSLKVAWLSGLALQRVDIISVSRPHLERLQAATGETVHIGVLEKASVVCIAKVDSDQPVKLRSAVGRQMRIHVTSLGRAIVAYMGEDEREEVLARIDYEPVTHRSVTSAEELRQALEQVRSRGYAIDDEESQAGIRCVGAPIFNHTGSVVAALSVSGWTITMTQGRVPGLAEQVTNAARAISRDLGHCPDARLAMQS